MTDPHDRDLERRIVATLDAGCHRLDTKLQRRLADARATALAQPERAPRAWWSAPALGAVGLMLLATVVSVSLLRPKPESDSPPMTADLDIVTDPRFELILEDPEFVAWLAESGPVETDTNAPPENRG